MLSTPTPKGTTYKLLSTWFKLFNFCILGGTLTHVSLILKSDPKQGVLYGRSNEPAGTIEIYMTSEKPNAYSGSIEECRLCVLLHEMVHAFVKHYSCNRSCCGTPLNNPAFGGAGVVDRHGPVWADTMANVSALVRQTVNWPVYTGIDNSVIKSMCLSNYQPTKKQLDHWGMDPMIWGHIDNWDDRRLKFIASHSKPEVES